MIALHAAFHDGRLLLWGESTNESNNGRKKRRSKQLPIESPLNAGDKQLVAALSGVIALPNGKSIKAEDVIAWLPTAGNQPIASHPLIADAPANATIDLQPWRATAIPLHIESAIDLLCACINQKMLAPGVLIGKSLAYWSAALRFAGEVVAREQFLPSMIGNGNAVARWQPVLTGAEAHRLAKLAQAMPAACRALSSADDGAPQNSSQQILRAFVGVVVDSMVRSALAPQSTLTRSGGKTKSYDSVHDEWLAALRGDSGEMHANGSSRQQLLEQLQDWRRPIQLAQAAPFRLCLRLEEPESTNGDSTAPKDNANGDDWHLRFLLQGVEDPSLLIPAQDAWQMKSGKTAVLAQSDFDPREYLLTALGQTAAIYPAVEASLKKADPSGFSMDVQEAFAFLTEKAWILEQAGFGILLPGWWTRKGTKQRLTARAKTTSRGSQMSSGISLDSLVKFEWEIALGDKSLTREELEALAKLKAPLVKIRGQWVQVSAEEIQAALDFWKNKGKSEASLRDIVRMSLGATQVTGGLHFEGVKATGWIKKFMAQLEGQSAFDTLELPNGFDGELRPYQERGYSWLGFLQRWGLGACLADDMGLGKTIQTLVLLEQNREGGAKKPTLLVCPMSVVNNWQKEAERFTPDLPVMVHHGPKRAKGKKFHTLVKKHALVLTSYALLHRDFELFKDISWNGIILDEAQNIKNPTTKQAKAARALPGDFRIALTGTPVENHVGDLWSIMEFLNPGFLGNQAEFRRAFQLPIQAYNDERASKRLKRLTGPFVLRRLKTDKSIISDLPDKIETTVYCNLTKEQASLYQAVVAEADKDLNEAEGIQRRGVVLGLLSKLKQVCNHPAQFLGDNSAIDGRSGKLKRLMEMMEEVLEVGDRALIFTQFTEMGDIIKKHLEETFGTEVLFLHGSVTKKKRDQMVTRFQAASNGAPDQPQVFLLSLKAGGTGLNLTAASHVFHFDRWWNPAVENQATDRAFRIGQKSNVQVHKFLCVGTLEERINEMIERKQQIAGMVVGTGEAWLTELSNEQLKELFQLRQETIEG